MAYVRRIIALDAVCALLAGVIGHVFRFGPADDGVDVPATSNWFLVVLPVVWVVAMSVARTYEPRFLWVGPEEFRRVFFAAALLLAAVGTVSWAFKLEVARGYVVIAIPLAAALTLAQRWVQRDRVHRQRRAGRLGQTALLVGHRNGVAALRAQIARESQHGYQIVGCCLPGGSGGTFDGLPVLGGLDDVVAVVARHQVDTVAVLPSPELEGAALRRLGWDLEQTEAELLLAPATTDVAGPRVNIRPMFGLPLMHVERPEFSGARRIVKDLFDRTAALLIVAVLLPLLIGISLAVKTTSRGPVFFRHERVGRDGQAFHVLKFRSMVPGADTGIDALRELSEGNAVQFKMRSDPRVTRVGRVLRRYSLDELPQLFNVLTGSMSLVGPRPHVTAEVEQYGFDMRRRLLVKPGITGLWQVSGRSDLSWDDTVRLDVRYVENWSLTMDLMILAKTVGAVVRGSGAY
ncbi:sugar transferase [Modestobacter sp. Leaf380]|uniref:sugar transferase n=1 Tax=Modestobacter sp. Leaf380 TaxID=1736356 RepID=UPI000AF35AB4|nr:sugar transferase [Modestobacter sp. Leaf380]